jgi:hypothetical protein
MLVSVKNIGQYGVNKDLSTSELPINAWTDAKNIRFLDGYAYQFYGDGEVYNSPAYIPQYVMPQGIGGVRYWIYTTASKAFAVTNTGGVTIHTDISHVTPKTGVVNNWTSASLSGVPVINAGDGTKPMSWDLNLANKFIDLPNFPASTSCKALRVYGKFLIALNLTKTGTNFPFMVKWSNPADPGTLPTTWDETLATQEAGEVDLSEGGDVIVDGLQLRSSFMIYKEASIYRMDYIGGQSVFSFNRLAGTNGILNRNCAVEIDGMHLVLTGSDVIIHDGQNIQSVLDKTTRRYLFQNIDVDSARLSFVFKNPFFNEVFICYPAIGSTSCNKAIVYNYKDKTISFRDLANLNHADFGSVDNGLAGNWNQDSAPWSSDLTLWGGGDFTPSSARVLMAMNGLQLFLLDASSSFSGSIPESYIERRGLTFDDPSMIKLIRGIRPRIIGSTGDTVMVSVGYANSPDADPTYNAAVPFTIGTTVSVDSFVSGRYIAVKFATGTAYQWRLDSFEFDVQPMGQW